MSDPRELDVFTCALEGVSQIEASAGTGKTWNICVLYVRLLLEKKLSAEQILVVTFTKAATAELHERIRDRLRDVIQVLDGLLDADHDDAAAAEHADRAAALSGGDPFIARLLEITIGPGAHHAISLTEARLRLQHAVRGFDQAAIHTIHAFCQRALQQAPFAAGMPFEFELAHDDRELRLDTAVQFWRTCVEPLAASEAGFAAWLVDGQAGPSTLDSHLARRLKKPLAQLKWGAQGEAGLAPRDSAHGNQLAHILREAYAHAASLWQREQDSLTRALEQAQPGLKLTSHKPELVQAACAAWGRYFAAGLAVAPPAGAARIGRTRLNDALKKGAALPEHPFFAAADALIEAAQAQAAWHEHLWLRVIRQWLEWAPAALHQRKIEHGTVSFDDLLGDLHRALSEHPWLALTIRQRYAAALIDEFQDTDPLQFDIFTRVFAPAGEAAAPLFLVGDPKQAIYSFRAADLHTYLAARERATARYTLAVNQRSTAPLIAACNRIFSANPAAFILPGLVYEPVRSGTRVRAPLRDDAGDDPCAGALRVWRLPGGEALWRKREAQMHCAQACAAEIVRLLEGARAGRVALGETPLAPGDMAVLVQTKKQGGLVKRVLAQWGVGSVELSQASVFASADAACLERVLQAIDTPGDPRRLRAALATDWLGLDAQALWALDHPPGVDDKAADATSWVELFARYRLLWNERGFATMWRTVLQELQIQQKLAVRADGERRLTDLAHLAELAQTQAASQAGLAPMLRWLASQRQEPGLGEETQLRLESDRNLVQIVTVHKSKGLEYPVVFCPFLNDNGQRPHTGSRLPDAIEYRDDAGAVVHYGYDDATATLAQAQASVEQAAERARLIYVALTRAVHRCYLVSGPYASGPRASSKEARKSVLDWLAGGAGHDFARWQASPPEENELDAAWRALGSAALSLHSVAPAAAPRALAALAPGDARYAARLARRTLSDSWRIASFSALAASGATGWAGAAGGGAAAGEAATLTIADDALAGRLAGHDQAGLRPDHDGYASLQAGAAAAPLAEPLNEPLPHPRGHHDILDFPRGAAPGECLHRMFELADFRAPDTWPLAVDRALRERPVAVDGALAARLPAMMMGLLADVVNTRLAPAHAPHLTLAQIGPARRLTELEFSFPARAVKLSRLQQLLRTHGYGELPELAFNGGWLDGYLKGFIDLVFEYDGRFWVLDWKSNFLGEQAGDYASAALDDAMQAHMYTLQALIYIVALHRYLRHRLPAYDYEQHLGGSLYLFVRAVRPDWCNNGVPAGVWCDRPALSLIEALDQLMQGALP